MEPITTIILSGIIYDLFKSSATLQAAKLKEKLRSVIHDDDAVTKLNESITALNLNDGMSEKIICQTMEKSQDIMEVLNRASISGGTHQTIIQSHSGSGDNVGRDKVTNNK